jgi:segregation and condensation protein B
MSLEIEKVKNIIEAALFSADKPLSLDQIVSLFQLDEQPERAEIKEILKNLQEEYSDRGIELKLVSSGYRFQAQQQYSEWVSRLWEEKAPRYTRALLETLALIAYRQPITRAEIEDVRGVGVSTNIMKTLQERDWVKIVGHRDVPGRPALYATTREFLDYFNMKTMDDLPTLAEIRSLDQINGELDLEEGGQKDTDVSDTSNEVSAVPELASEGQDTDESDLITESTDTEIESVDNDIPVNTENDAGNEQSAESEETAHTDIISKSAAAEPDQPEGDTVVDIVHEVEVEVEVEAETDNDQISQEEDALDAITNNASAEYATAPEGTLLN